MSEKREFRGRAYEIVFGSDVQRDGVFLELSDRTGPEIEILAEVFFYDEQGRVVFNSYKNDIPYQLIIWLIEAASKEGWPIDWSATP